MKLVPAAVWFMVVDSATAGLVEVGGLITSSVSANLWHRMAN